MNSLATDLKALESSMSEEDQIRCDQFYDELEEREEMALFVDELWRAQNPLDPDFGCFIVKEGQAMIYDHTNREYAPVGCKHIQWPYPDIRPPVIWWELEESQVCCPNAMRFTLRLPTSINCLLCVCCLLDNDA